MITVEQLKSKYTDIRVSPPVGCGDFAEGCCVGGALGLELGHKNKYPRCLSLGEYLQEANPELNEIQSMIVANWITIANDDMRFEDAWDCSDSALTYPEDAV